MNSKADGTETLDLNSKQSWNNAIRYAETISYVPESIAFCIKVTRANYTRNKEEGRESIEPHCFAAVRLVDRIASLKVPVYFAASKLYPQKFEHNEDDTTRALLRTLGPGMFSSVLITTYLYRRITHFAAGEVWNRLNLDYRRDSEIGFLLGRVIPELDETDGVLVGAIRYAALGAFLLKDPSVFEKYLNRHRGSIDLTDEHARWGCDHSQVAYAILSMLGFTRERLEGYNRPRDQLAVRDALLGLYDPEVNDRGLRNWAALIAMIESLKEGKLEVPEWAGFSVDDNTRLMLERDVEELMASGDSFDWMGKNYKDIDFESPGASAQSPAPTAAISPEVAIPGVESEDVERLSQDELDAFLDATQEYSAEES